MNENAICGCLLGTAIGDALGLPYEKLSPARAARLMGPPDRFRFLFRKGMISDDTEHSCMVAQSLIEAMGQTEARALAKAGASTAAMPAAEATVDIKLFEQHFARRLRWWVLGVPAGTGKATLKAGLKLWLGIKPRRAGVFSAGNGPAMRAAIFGAAIDDRESMLALIRSSSRLTHRDPKAEFGAVAVALAARHAHHNALVNAQAWLAETREYLGEDGVELTELLEKAVASVQRGEDCFVFATSLGMAGGVSGYTYDTVPVAIHVWLSHQHDFRRAITVAILLGGDADTTAAIVGGIVGAGVGREGLPGDLLAGIKDFPRSVDWIDRLGNCLARSVAGDTSVRSPRVNPIAVVIRNALFLAVVLVHGFRRLAPPY